MADLDIEETNRVRKALGMQPLPGPGGLNFKSSKGNDSDSDSDSEEELTGAIERQAYAADNWRKLQEEKDAKARKEAKKIEIRKARERAERDRVLEGKGLGEADADDPSDTRSWLLGAKKRQKKIEKARKLAEELEERERLNAPSYTAADLTGVKVGHELDEFNEGGEQILTLKDADVLDESEGDELENADLRDKEKREERLKLKRKKPAYNPMDDDGSGERRILAQYDEETDGKKRKLFTLDGQGNTSGAAAIPLGKASSNANGVKITFDIEEDRPASDYMDITEVKIKKPKKKKSKHSRKKAADEDEIFPVGETANAATQESMDVDQDEANGATSRSNQRRFEDASFIDDDDLQATLAAQRRAALKKRKQSKAEGLIPNLRDGESASPVDPEIEEGIEPGMLIDTTSEFVGNLHQTVESDDEGSPKPLKSSANGATAASPEEDDDVEMKESLSPATEGVNERASSIPAGPQLSATGIEEEKSAGAGIGATLKLLRERNLIENSNPETKINALRQSEHFKAELRKRHADLDRKAKDERDQLRRTGRWDRMTKRDQEEYAQRENRNREAIESRLAQELFSKEYKPNVELKYVDEFGRQMNQKEAFKMMSHQFHGKGSGKGKQEKRLKKISEEKKKMAESSLDSSKAAGIDKAQGYQTKKEKKAGVRLQ